MSQDRKDSKEEKRSRVDIQVLDENTKGKTYVIGDVHGSLNLFDKLVSQLGEHDNIIMVGDLTDRGPNSLGVINRIFEVNKPIIEKNEKRAKQGLEPLPLRIYAIRGNHEEMFLGFMEAKAKSEENKSEEWKKHSFLLPNNGGIWVEKKETKKEDLLKVQKYFESLPYIIHVNGKKPFTVAHAIMPMSINQLHKKIQLNDFNLNPFEKSFVTWARFKASDPNLIDVNSRVWKTNRDEKTPGLLTLVAQDNNEVISMTIDKDFSNVIIVGHDIGKGFLNKQFNIDSGSNQFNMLCYIDRSSGKCELIVADPMPKEFLATYYSRLRGGISYDELNMADTDIGSGKSALIIQAEIQLNLLVCDIVSQSKIIQEKKLSQDDKAKQINDKAKQINDLVNEASVKLFEFDQKDIKTDEARKTAALSEIQHSTVSLTLKKDALVRYLAERKVCVDDKPIKEKLEKEEEEGKEVPVVKVEVARYNKKRAANDKHAAQISLAVRTTSPQQAFDKISEALLPHLKQLDPELEEAFKRSKKFSESKISETKKDSSGSNLRFYKQAETKESKLTIESVIDLFSSSQPEGTLKSSDHANEKPADLLNKCLKIYKEYWEEEWSIFYPKPTKMDKENIKLFLENNDSDKDLPIVFERIKSNPSFYSVLNNDLKTFLDKFPDLADHQNRHKFHS